MKNWIYIFIIGLMGSLVSSCQQSLDEEIQLPLDTPRAANISMRLVLNDQPTASRTWGNNEDTDGQIGNTDENEIGDIKENPNALQVFVEVPNGPTLKVVEQTIIRLDTENGRVYNLDGILDLNNTGIEARVYQRCKVKVFANCAGGLNEYTFSKDALIPMWGVQTTDLNLASLANNQIEDIYLLRAMAKVEVRLDEAIAEDFDIASVSVDKYNTKGYVQPTGAESAIDTRNLGLQDVFNVCASEGEQGLAFTEIEEDVFTVYLPEYDNSTDPATISLTINGKPYTIEFKNYEDGSATGEAYNIVRNHYYQYTITSVKSGLDLILSVVPWTVKEVELSYTEHTASYAVDESGLGWNSTSIDSQDDENVYLHTGNNVDAASFKVKLMTPYGAKWMAVLEDTEDKFTFDTGAGFSGEAVEGSTKTIGGSIGNDAEGTIVTLGIKAKDSSETGEYSAELRLFVQVDNGKWFEIDLTDGDVDNGVKNYIINHLKSSM